MVYVILDIETVAHPDAHLWLDPVKPDARLSDPVKVEASIKERTQERLETLALHPDTNRIVALGYHVVGQETPECLLMRDEYEEHALVRQFWDCFREWDKRTVRLVTFYGLSFDIPTLLSRSMYLDLDFPEIDVDRYRSPHAAFDLWWRLSRKGAIKAHSLKFYAKRMGFTTLDKVDGSQIAQLVADEDWNAVEAHCLSDIGLTHALANRLKVLKVA